MLDEIEDTKRLAEVLTTSRKKANISQDEMGMYLGTSKNTISSYEKGKSHITMHQFKRWMKACGFNPLPFMCKLFDPDIVDILQSNSPEDEKIRTGLIRIIKVLPMSEVRLLMFQLMGGHGSDPHKVLHLFDAYLHLPMISKAIIARNIVEAYEIHQERGELLGTDFTSPDINGLHLAIESGKLAAKNKENQYTL